ncbi:helix-turn-helix domain-containing protein [Saccharothrix australiensis]|uniref:XRE family transcriptional regulator n=1 Tax=Saccharothrix australiensis TaxID=2072 RepID=A0A495W4A0_9PSEU|nr:XRE family transcriptional regulator [Saccharothrix australiensis]RKT55595.1 XRE family transcriptional regulator [Saccharothrix australiensis]
MSATASTDDAGRQPASEPGGVEPADGAAQDRNARVGLRLRAAREAAKMSLREMARRVGLSPSFVSQVELGRAAPSVGTLYAMVRELGLSLDSLMAGDAGSRHAGVVPAPGAEGPSQVVALPEVGALPGLQRAGERPDLYLNGVRWERLTPEDDPDVEFLRVTYPPGTESCPVDNLMNHGGKEYVHVLAGRLEVQVAFARQVLFPGDSLNFDSSIPHRLSNPFDETCVAIWFVVGRQGRPRHMSSID